MSVSILPATLDGTPSLPSNKAILDERKSATSCFIFSIYNNLALWFAFKVCKKYNIEQVELTSKLEARNVIDKIITDHAPNLKCVEEQEEC